MNKKGFAFVETVLVLTIVTLSLTLLLSSYSLITRKTKEKENYDKGSDKYLLYSILNSGVNNVNNYPAYLNNCESEVGSIKCNIKITPDNCYTKPKNNNGDKLEILDNIYGTTQLNGKYVCTNLYENMNIMYLYVIQDVQAALKDTNAVKFFDNGTVEYIKTLKKCNDINYTMIDENGHTILKDPDVCSSPVSYLVGVFYRNNDYYFASIEI